MLTTFITMLTLFEEISVLYWYYDVIR